MRGTNCTRSTLAVRKKQTLGGASAAPWKLHVAADYTPKISG